MLRMRIIALISHRLRVHISMRKNAGRKVFKLNASKFTAATKAITCPVSKHFSFQVEIFEQRR